MYNPFSKKVKVGLAFGGGGTRGFTHLGVIKAFEEFGVKFDCVAGTSAGSLVGAMYCAGFSFAKMYDIAKNLRTKDIRKNIIPFTPSKLDGLEQVLHSVFGDITIEELPLPLLVCAVDIKNPREICFSKGSLAKTCMGSCAVPAIFQPVEYQDMILCDGGLQNTIPADYPRYYGCDYVVSIDCNKSRGYGSDSTKFFDVLTCSIRILMKSNAIRGYENSDIVIAPETKRFNSTKTDGLDDMIEEGYKAAVDIMPKILELFNKRRHVRSLPRPEEIKFID